MIARDGVSGARLRAGRLTRFLEGLRSWQLFVIAGTLLAIDLVIPDPIPFLDETFLIVLTYMLSRWKTKPSR